MNAIQWFSNGDHPDDDTVELTDEFGRPFLSEGKVVRYYRHPTFCGVSHCPKCEKTLHVHGWIDNGGNGQVVCPGDIIYTVAEGVHVVVPYHLTVAVRKAGTPLLVEVEELQPESV